MKKKKIKSESFINKGFEEASLKDVYVLKSLLLGDSKPAIFVKITLELIILQNLFLM
ncbi:hypothetical protein [endosymbiont 'TC1' of Trimyema compressum]|uniref:hypothetical protein n=1 Tax=endosymbiont 'TC1' of Trimyema compressum TaxID=243899 RepID=UPI0013923BAF|nr:hypothetical protein [endosymbiont 'TC1' of Trimyema compressum]